MTDSNNNEATIALQEENSRLKSERDDLLARLSKIESKVAQKDAQDLNDRAAATAKAQGPHSQNRLIQFQKPTNGYAPPKPEDEVAARRIFGRGSDSRAANSMALKNFGEYSRLRQVAVDLQLIA